MLIDNNSMIALKSMAKKAQQRNALNAQQDEQLAQRIQIPDIQNINLPRAQGYYYSDEGNGNTDNEDNNSLFDDIFGSTDKNDYGEKSILGGDSSPNSPVPQTLPQEQEKNVGFDLRQLINGLSGNKLGGNSSLSKFSNMMNGIQSSNNSKWQNIISRLIGG